MRVAAGSGFQTGAAPRGTAAVTRGASAQRLEMTGVETPRRV